MSGQKSSVKDDVVDLVDLVDIEECGKAGHRPPKGLRYRIRIDKQHHIVRVTSMTGRQLLELACKLPVERFSISQKFKGGKTESVELDEFADFTRLGVERFMTLPLDQSEG